MKSYKKDDFLESYKKDGFYIHKDEEPLIKYIWYILPSNEQNLSQIDNGHALTFLQNELNELLHSFVNGGFSYKGYILFPFGKDVSKNNIKGLKKLKEIVISLNDKGYDFLNSINAYKNNPKKSINFASILSSLYQDFSSIRNENVRLIKKSNCREFDSDEYKKSDLEYLKPLFELKDYATMNLKQYLSGFYLHGSFATKDYIKGWSDVDTLAIVSKETINNPNKLLELRKKMFYIRHFLYKIDPLQHHGSIIISEYDLQNYCNVYFPVEIFKYSKSFFRDGIENLKLRKPYQEALAKLFWFVNYFRKLKIENKRMGSYEVKNLLHCITLFPSMYLNAKNIFIYKKFSFDIAKKDFKKKVWRVVDEASAIRRNWKGFGKMSLVSLGSRINPLIAYQLNSRLMDLFNDIAGRNNINTRYLVENMFKLSEEAWSKVKENAKNKKL